LLASLPASVLHPPSTTPLRVVVPSPVNGGGQDKQKPPCVHRDGFDPEKCFGDFQPAASRPTNKLPSLTPSTPAGLSDADFTSSYEAACILSMFGARDTQQVLYAAFVTLASVFHRPHSKLDRRDIAGKQRFKGASPL